MAIPGNKPMRIASTGYLSHVFGMIVIGVPVEDGVEVDDGLVKEGLPEVAVTCVPELVAIDDVPVLPAELCC